VTILGHIQACPTRVLAQKTFVIFKKRWPNKSLFLGRPACTCSKNPSLEARKARPRGRMLKSDRFRFLDSGIDPISARATDLLASPPHLLHMNCLSCSYHTSLDLQPLGEDARHFVRCPKGLGLHSTVSDRVRDELAYISERCDIRVIAERPGSHRQMSSFMLREGSSLLKQPDIIIPDLDGPRSFTLIDVKIKFS